MRPPVPGLSKLRVWTASRLSMSRPRSQLPWKSFTGSSAALIDVSDATKESGKAHQLAPRFRILITTTRMLFRHGRGLGRRDPHGPAVLGTVASDATPATYRQTARLTYFTYGTHDTFSASEGGADRAALTLVPCEAVPTLRCLSYDIRTQDRGCGRAGSCRLWSLGAPSAHALGRKR